MLKPILCDYNDPCILVSGTTTIKGGPEDATEADKERKEEIFKNCTPIIECTTELNNTQIDHAKDLDLVMPVYNLTEYNDNYFKTSESLWQYYRDEPALNNINKITNFTGNSTSFKSKVKVTGKTPC